MGEEKSFLPPFFLRDSCSQVAALTEVLHTSSSQATYVGPFTGPFSVGPWAHLSAKIIYLSVLTMRRLGLTNEVSNEVLT